MEKPICIYRRFAASLKSAGQQPDCLYGPWKKNTDDILAMLQSAAKKST